MSAPISCSTVNAAKGSFLSGFHTKARIYLLLHLTTYNANYYSRTQMAKET